MASVDEAIAALGGGEPASVDQAISALEAEQSAAKQDTATFSGAVGKTGAGIWNSIAQMIGLPGTILDWVMRTEASNAERMVRIGQKEPQAGLALADELRERAKLIPTGDTVRDVVPTIYNAAASRFGGEEMTPYRPLTKEDRAYEVLGENIGAAVTLGMGGAAYGASRIGGGADTALRAKDALLRVTPLDRALSEGGKRLATNLGTLGLATAEAGLGAAAAGGQLIGEEIADRWHPDPEDLGSRVAKAALPTVGNLLGGGAGGLLGTTVRGTAKAIKGSVSPYISSESYAPLQKMFGTDAAERIAAEIAWRKQSGTVDEAITNLDNFATDLGNGSLFSAAQMARDGGLLTLERAIITSDAKRIGLRSLQDQRFQARVQDYLRQNVAVEGATEGATTPETPLVWFRRIVEQSSDAIDRRVDAAARDLKAQIDTMGSKPPLTQMSAAARAQVDMAYRDARLQESALWNPLKTDESFKVDLSPVRKELDLIKADQAKASDPNDYPRKIDELLTGTKKQLIAEQEMVLKEMDQQMAAEVAGNNFGAAEMIRAMRAQEQAKLDYLNSSAKPVLENFETLREVLALRSRVLDMARDARSETSGSAANRNLAFNLDRIGSTILDTVGRTAEARGDELGQSVLAARDYSRKLNDVFTRGPMADILGRDPRGGLRVDPRVTLGKLVGEGEQGFVNMESLLDTEGFANTARQKLIERGLVPEGATGKPLEQIIEGYLAQRYLSMTAKRDKDGQLVIDPAAHERFISQEGFGEQLDKFPNLRGNLNDVERRSAMLDNLKRDAGEQRKIEKDTAHNSLALWLDGDPESALNRVLGNSKRQGEMMRELVLQAKRDPRGEALPAMRRMFFDEMMADGRINTTDPSGNRIMTGVSLQKFLDQNGKAINELFEPWQRRALGQAVKEIQVAESTANARAFRGDSPTQMTAEAMKTMDQTALSTMLKAVFATGRFTGSIHSVPFISNFTTSIDSRLSQRAMGILGDALTGNDPALLKTLLLKPTPENVPTIRARLRPYLAAPAIERDDR